jgi:hypothetical protein
MTTRSMAAPNTAFRIAWMTLMGLAVLATVGHIGLAFVLSDEAVLFIGWATFSAYAALVLAIPFRRGERWAWYATWIMVVVFASLILFDPQVGAWYVGMAAIMAVCLLVTRGAFFNHR